MNKVINRRENSCNDRNNDDSSGNIQNDNSFHEMCVTKRHKTPSCMFKSANKALRLACMFSVNGKVSVLEYISSLLFKTIILLFKEIEKKNKEKNDNTHSCFIKQK